MQCVNSQKSVQNTHQRNLNKMSSLARRECAVLNCKNTSYNTEITKLFIQVPTESRRRKIWLDLSKRDLKRVTHKTKLYFCEDHFDLQHDFLNYMEYKIMGPTTKIRMKPNCIPSKLVYDPDKMPARSTGDYLSSGQGSWSGANKRKRISLTYEGESTEDWNILSHRPDDLRNNAARRKTKHKRRNGVKVEIEQCDSEEDKELNVIKEEIEIINRAIGNLYKDRNIREELVVSSETLQKENGSNQDEYLDVVETSKVYDIDNIVKEEEERRSDEDINVLDDDYIIKEEEELGPIIPLIDDEATNVLDKRRLIKDEISLRSEVTDDENINVLDEDYVIKKGIVLRSEVTDDENINVLDEDHVIKKEIVLRSEITDDESISVLDEDYVIKKEIVLRSEVTDDENINVLDEDHVIKKEIVLRSEITDDESINVDEDYVIKKEIVLRSEVTDDENINVLDVDHVIKKEIVLRSEVTDDENINVLDVDHVIKKEIVLRSEVTDDENINVLDEDHVIKKGIVLRSEVTDDENINVLDEDHVIKKEIVLRSEVTDDENINVLDEDHVIKKEIVLRSEITDDESINVLDEDYVIKKEIVLKSEVTNDEGTNIFDKYIIKTEMVFEQKVTNDSPDLNFVLKKEIKVDVDTESYNENNDVEINKKPDLKDMNLYIKNEKEVYLNEDYVQHADNRETVEDVTKDLYEDHIVKDEMVVGPEKIQKVLISPNSIKNIKVKKKQLKVKSSYMYTCNYCKKGFQTRKYIKQHLWQHEHSNLNCHVCGKKFTFENNLKRHLQAHSGKKPFACDQCFKTFARKEYLKFHIHYHHIVGSKMLQNIRPTSICEFCNKEFSSKCSRDHHKKYSCPMNVNKQKLCKNKLYICDICNKSYTYRSSLSAHIMRCHMKKALGPLHQCDYCGKQYMKKHNLQCHMQSKHLNIKPYKCRKCDETFTWHSTLAKHERKVHGSVKGKLKKG